MKIHLDTGDGRHRISRYEPGLVVIDEHAYERSLVVTPDRILPDWRPRHFAELDREALTELAGLDAEIVLLGTGRALRFPSQEALLVLLQGQIGVECMDTGAACRTYNLLMGEGRKVAAALLLADPPAPAAA